MNGLYLQEHQVRLVVNKQKKLVVKPNKLEKYVDEPLFLLAKNKIYGIIKLGKPQQVEIEKFPELYKDHLINEMQRKKWWGKEKSLYVYSIEIIKLFRPSLYWRLTDRPRTFVDNVEIEKSISIKIPIEQLTLDHLKLLSHPEINGIKKRIEFISTLMDAKSAGELRKVAAGLYQAPVEKKVEQTDNFILQLHFSSVTGDDATLDMEQLKKKYPYQYVLRLQKDDKVMTGWDIRTQSLNGEKMESEPKDDQDAKIWMDVAKYPSYVVNIDGGMKTKYFTLDRGTYKGRKLSETAFEYVFKGDVMKDQYICSRRYRGKRWLLEKVK